ncbi:hypothetical protein NLU13_0761 [Sarocladium strictum]|uniref:Endo-1,5-alpha-L-arabinanase A n=1 Tax=Sarocladium strictum TaxID=5046 RepID=A0AA39GPN0_SARSR|nr:hypothetical protein NLU13_0761 [Sarocladium strictum]
MRSQTLVAVAACLFASRVVAQEEYEGYAFAYFTGNSLAGENIFLAASNGNDALSWSELNGGQAVLKSQYGTRGLRDPFVIRSHDGSRFYLLATDLSIGSGTDWGDSQRFGSRYIEIWESEDLINWSEQRHTLVSPATAGMTWAPEAYYDDELGTYLVFWASALYAESDTGHTGASYNRMLYATTDDFVHFSEASVWQDSQASRIDSTVLKEGSTYYRFTKDEGRVTGCADIIQEHSTSLTSQLDGWTVDASCIGAKAGTEAVEGPTIFKANPNDVHGEKFYLFVDEYVNRGYIPLETDDIAKPDWKVSAQYNLPASPRHGTVIPVTKSELDNLTAALGSTPPSRREVLARQEENDGPTLPGFYADPNIAAFGCDYYLYATSDGYPGWGGQDFYAWKSRNLVDWARAEEPFLVLDGENGTVPWALGNAWAPTIIERDDKYYFYFSGQNAQYDHKTIGVAVANSPEGPFIAAPTAMITNTETVNSGQAIDPAAFQDPVSGRFYLYWGNGEPVLAELNDDMASINWATAQHVQGLEDFREGLFINYRQGIYHLTYSIDDTGSPDYRVGYATSLSPEGPFTYRGVILQKDESQGILATGHDSVLNVPGTDEWYMAYHRFAIPDGDGTHRETKIDKLFFDPDTGLIRPVVPTLRDVEPLVMPGCSSSRSRSRSRRH